ncbi:MAG TPA: response regulator [Stellaceae bacterium]|jgi:two-component system, chemotaxis family, chemotaxis protein CheY|nr:response regulator [Stellaceae bacterium]
MKKILIIEDNQIVRNTVMRILQSAGYTVVTANDGVQGFDMFRKERPDLVVSDIIMPQQEGIATIRQILTERPGTKIIAISGGGRIGNTDFLQIARKMGAVDALQKPFDPDDLLGRINNCLKAA